MSNTTKQVVQYAPQDSDFISVDQRASVVPVDHPDSYRVTNGLYVSTSRVLSHNTDTGVFETLNSVYVPVAAYGLSVNTVAAQQ